MVFSGAKLQLTSLSKRWPGIKINATVMTVPPNGMRIKVGCCFVFGGVFENIVSAFSVIPSSFFLAFSSAWEIS